MQDVAVMRRFFDGMAAGDFAEVRDLLAEELVAFPLVGDHEPVVRGREAFLAHATAMREGMLDLRLESVEELKPGYVLATGTARHDGVAYELHVLGQLRDGRIRMLESHGSRQQALATVGH